MTFHTTNIQWLAIGIDDGVAATTDVLPLIQQITEDDTPTSVWSYQLAEGSLYSVTVHANVRNDDGTVKATFHHGFSAFGDPGAVVGYLGTENVIQPDSSNVTPSPYLAVSHDATHVYLLVVGLPATHLHWTLALTLVPTSTV